MLLFFDVNKPLNHDADPYYVRETALDIALKRGNEQVAMYLIEHGARLTYTCTLPQQLGLDLLHCLIRHDAISFPTNLGNALYEKQQHEHVDALAARYADVPSVRERRHATDVRRSDQLYHQAVSVAWHVMIWVCLACALWFRVK